MIERGGLRDDRDHPSHLRGEGTDRCGACGHGHRVRQDGERETVHSPCFPLFVAPLALAFGLLLERSNPEN